MGNPIAFEPVQLPPQLQDLRREVRAFVQAQVPVGAHYTQSSRAFSRKLGERGWIGMTWPARWGGGERSDLARYVVSEELIAAGAPIFYHWVADRQSGPLILRFGTDDQRARFLPAIAKGECGFAIGLSEPDAGSDLSALRTRATRRDGGWRISGTKIWTSNAHEADFIIVLCRTGDSGGNRHQGFTQFIVDLHAPGVQVRPILNIAAAHEFNEVALDEVFVAQENRLGEVGDGWKQLMSELAFERSGPDRFLSALALLRRFIDAIGTSPDDAQAEFVGRCVARLRTLRMMSMSVASMLHDRAPNVEAAIVKDLGNELEQDIVEGCRRLLPACAATTDDPSSYARALQDAQLYMPRVTIQGGTPQILRNGIARALGMR
ncbi:MAG: acyl-CoA dehydrogenase family protein [Lautropia sp.]